MFAVSAPRPRTPSPADLVVALPVKARSLQGIHTAAMSRPRGQHSTVRIAKSRNLIM
jgi:hypothetical protein